MKLICLSIPENLVSSSWSGSFWISERNVSVHCSALQNWYLQFALQFSLAQILMAQNTEASTSVLKKLLHAFLHHGNKLLLLLSLILF